MEQQSSQEQQQELRNAEDLKLAIGLSELFELGFTDDSLNTELLKKYNYNIELVFMELLQISQVQPKRKSNEELESQDAKKIKDSSTSPGDGQRQSQPQPGSSRNLSLMFPQIGGGLPCTQNPVAIGQQSTTRRLFPIVNPTSTLARAVREARVRELICHIVLHRHNANIPPPAAQQSEAGCQFRMNTYHRSSASETQSPQGEEASSTSTEVSGQAPIESQTLLKERQNAPANEAQAQPLDLETPGSSSQHLRAIGENDLGAVNNKNDAEKNADKTQDVAPEPVAMVDENVTVKEEFPDSVDLECPICFEEYDSTSCIKMNPDPCGHHICEGCYKKLEVSGHTISGVLHKFYKCPVCNRTNGIKTGSGPAGTLDIWPHAEFFNKDINIKWIRIVYRIPSYPKYVGYLPNSVEGQEVAQLLRQAFEHRLTFSAVTNNTSTTAPESWFAQAVGPKLLKFNIEHKTKNSYPDPDYLQRVKAQLKEYGIQ